MTQIQTTTTRFIEYRNAVYQGCTNLKSRKRNGPGILITDSNTIIISEWKNDQMSAKTIMITDPENYGFGEFNRGEI